MISPPFFVLADLVDKKKFVARLRKHFNFHPDYKTKDIYKAVTELSPNDFNFIGVNSGGYIVGADSCDGALIVGADRMRLLDDYLNYLDRLKPPSLPFQVQVSEHHREKVLTLIWNIYFPDGFVGNRDLSSLINKASHVKMEWIQVEPSGIYLSSVPKIMNATYSSEALLKRMEAIQNQSSTEKLSATAAEPRTAQAVVDAITRERQIIANLKAQVLHLTVHSALMLFELNKLLLNKSPHNGREPRKAASHKFKFEVHEIQP